MTHKRTKNFEVELDYDSHLATVTRASWMYGTKAGQQMSEHWLRERLQRMAKADGKSVWFRLLHNPEPGKFIFKIYDREHPDGE